MTTFRVVLRVTPNEGEDRPGKWDWQELLGCEVEQVSVEEAEVSLYDQCSAIYHGNKDGQSAVEQFIREQHPEVLWAFCSACEGEEPSENNTCLVCGSSTAEHGAHYQCIDPKCPSAGTYHDHEADCPECTKAKEKPSTGKKKYRVTLSGLVPTEAEAEVEADSPEEAGELAVRLGNLDQVTWHDSNQLEDVYAADIEEIKE